MIRPPDQCGNGGRGLFADQVSRRRNRAGENGSIKLGVLPRRDQFRHALAGDRRGLEAVRSPADVHVEVVHFLVPRP